MKTTIGVDLQDICMSVVYRCFKLTLVSRLDVILITHLRLLCHQI